MLTHGGIGDKATFQNMYSRSRLSDLVRWGCFSCTYCQHSVHIQFWSCVPHRLFHLLFECMHAGFCAAALVLGTPRGVPRPS